MLLNVSQPYVPATQVIGLIAGDQAMTVAVGQDSLELGRQDLIDLNLNSNDTVIGVLQVAEHLM